MYIKNTEFNYSVYRDGTVVSYDRRITTKKGKTRIIKGRKLKQTDINGYKAYHIHFGNVSKLCYAHRLVAEHFLPDWDHNLTVDHIDNDRSNNNVENLRMMTLSNNCRRGNTGTKGIDKWGQKYRVTKYIGLFDSLSQAETAAEEVEQLIAKWRK